MELAVSSLVKAKADARPLREEDVPCVENLRLRRKDERFKMNP